jgi:hypothetical protein
VVLSFVYYRTLHHGRNEIWLYTHFTIIVHCVILGISSDYTPILSISVHWDMVGLLSGCTLIYLLPYTESWQECELPVFLFVFYHILSHDRNMICLYFHFVITLHFVIVGTWSGCTHLAYSHTLCHGSTMMWLQFHISIIVHFVMAGPLSGCTFICLLPYTASYCDHDLAVVSFLHYLTLNHGENMIWLYSYLSITIHCIMV